MYYRYYYYFAVIIVITRVLVLVARDSPTFAIRHRPRPATITSLKVVQEINKLSSIHFLSQVREFDSTLLLGNKMCRRRT